MLYDYNDCVWHIQEYDYIIEGMKSAHQIYRLLGCFFCDNYLIIQDILLFVLKILKVDFKSPCFRSNLMWCEEMEHKNYILKFKLKHVC